MNNNKREYTLLVMKEFSQPSPRQSIDLESSWDRVAADFYRVSEPIFGEDRLIWGPYGPFEDEVQTIKEDLWGKRVLVAGCGSGPDVAYFAKRGAIVTGLDLSNEQLRLAERRLQETGTRAVLRKCDLNYVTVQELGADSFDLIVSNYALQYIEDLPRLLNVLSAALIPGGRIVVSVDHPVLYATYPDLQQKERRKKIATIDYLRERTLFWWFRMSHEAIRAYSFHRTMGTWFRAFREAGLEMERLEEPAPTTDSAFRSKSARLFAERVPYTVIFVASKKI